MKSWPEMRMFMFMHLCSERLSHGVEEIDAAAGLRRPHRGVGAGPTHFPIGLSFFIGETARRACSSVGTLRRANIA